MDIAEIAESSMKWGCKLQLNLTWVEGRVRWRDLRDQDNLNMISQEGPGQSTGQVPSMEDNITLAETFSPRPGQQDKYRSQVSGFLFLSSPTLLTMTLL